MSGVLDEYDNDPDRHRSPDSQNAADPRDESKAEVVERIHQLRDEARDRLRPEAGLADRLVSLPELPDHSLLLRKCLDNPLSGQCLFDIPVQVAKIALPLFVQRSRPPRNPAHANRHQRHDKKSQQS
ncbi:hypothetical protein D3C76_1567750 [compost metagenome]